MRFAPGALWYAVPAFLIALPAFFLSAWLTLVFAAIGGFVLFFYRDPDRSPPFSGIVSPADGKVTVIRDDGDRLRVGVFMSPFDVHVNRAPADGVVRSIEHSPGDYRPAFSKDSEHNERVEIDFGEYSVTLIAGAFARRITPYVEVGDELSRGEKIGHIAFGSRADVLLPPEIGREDLLIEKGERVTAGETLVAETGGEDPFGFESTETAELTGRADPIEA